MSAADTITVSRDTLRAELAGMELRLRIYLDSRVATKAEAADVAAVSDKLDAFDRGEMTPAQRVAIHQLAAQYLAELSAAAWTPKERGLAVLSALVAVATLAVSIVLAFHGVML